METWSKVKTADSVIGYVENKRLGDITEETETPVTDYQEPEYTALTSDSKDLPGLAFYRRCRR